ncbi:hypothetical protein FOA52_004178 [Chlamydomonas sp. UWO 241]|nr:hypothetical protein FOA52_004178 [Chlamydomonas sp. UWO 241]
MQLVQPVVVSLSGGVDSMVCLRALSELNVPLIAVHVNFGNRESDADREERFVRAYCRARGVDLVVRRFDEIQRDACMANDFRELYETYTKRERHATYLVAHRLLGIDDAGIASVRVVLGHHIDDVFENVLVNVANATKLKNLDGMTERALVFGDRIELWRPMIRLEKAVVFAYARRFGVPYFMNTTPDWVQRGILRTRVVPAIREWNPDFVPGLLQLSEQMKDAYVAVEAAVLMCGIGCSGSGSTGITAPRTKSELFWRVFLETHFTRALSSKSLRNFTSKVQTLPGPSGEFTVMLNKSTKVCCATTSDDRVVLRRKPI